MSLMIEGWIPSVGSSSTSTFGSVIRARRDGELLLLAAGKIAALALPHFGKHGEERIDLVSTVSGDHALCARDQVFKNGSELKIMRPCGTKARPARTRRCEGSPVISAPSTFTEPERLPIMPRSDFSRVVLPIPFRPMMARISPFFASKLAEWITSLWP